MFSCEKTFTNILQGNSKKGLVEKFSSMGETRKTISLPLITRMLLKKTFTISNMEDIHELMLWNDTCAFRVHMTAVLIQKTSLYSGVHRDSKFMHFDKGRVTISQNHTSNLDKLFLKLPPNSDFGLEARIFQIGWFYRPKWKKVEKSASKNKHPI